MRYAGASGDFNVIHWNERVATEVGLPNVIAHGMLTMAEAIRVVTDWCGDPAAVVEYSTRFTRPVPVPDDGAGATMDVTGSVIEVLDKGRVKIDLVATCDGAKVLGHGPRRRPTRMMRERHGVEFASLTTLRVGGPAERLVEASTRDELIEAMTSQPRRPLVIGGGSNLVVADAGVQRPAHRRTNHRCHDRLEDDRSSWWLAAGENWDSRSSSTASHEGWRGSRRCRAFRVRWGRPRSRMSVRTAKRSATVISRVLVSRSPDIRACAR